MKTEINLHFSNPAVTQTRDLPAVSASSLVRARIPLIPTCCPTARTALCVNKDACQAVSSVFLRATQLNLEKHNAYHQTIRCGVTLDEEVTVTFGSL